MADCFECYLFFALRNVGTAFGRDICAVWIGFHELLGSLPTRKQHLYRRRKYLLGSDA